MIPTSRTSWLSKKETNSTITNTLQQAFSTKKCDETKRAETTTTTTANKKTHFTPTAGETTTADTIGAIGEETTTTIITIKVTMTNRINRLLNSKEIVGSATNTDIKKSIAEPRNEGTRTIDAGTTKDMQT